MGIAMGISLLGNNSNVGQDVGLAGIGSFVGSKIKYPILGNYISETIQKYPSLLEKYFDEKKEDK
ncbi:hypothetical protein ACFFHT_09095 [Gallibacterium melopsittaci]|uniref:Uncharacterized protein n=1 Tax=Gallibacterium melopsittaci TaxID=516063 RepID=A0ABV6HXU9_9PAST